MRVPSFASNSNRTPRPGIRVSFTVAMQASSRNLGSPPLAVPHDLTDGVVAGQTGHPAAGVRRA